MKLLFICDNNLMRSPTAAELAEEMGHETRSAGIFPTARHRVEEADVAWADLIVTMEDHQREAIERRFPDLARSRRIVTLHIPDAYAYRDPALLRMLRRDLPAILEP